MTLTLTLTQTRGGGEPQSRVLTRGTVSIGRAAGNDWVLPDPDQHLSRTHCMVSVENGRAVLTDLSTNGMLINGARQPTTRNSRIILTDGDFFQLGGYTITATETDGSAPAASPPPDARADPLDVDPLADPLSDPWGHAAAAGFMHPLAHPPPAARVDDPFDQMGGGADDDLFRGGTPAESWTGPTQPDTADAVAFAYTAPRVIPPVNPLEVDFDDLIGDFPPAPPAPSPVLSPPVLSPPGAARPAPPPDLSAFDELIGELAPPPDSPPPPPAPEAAAEKVDAVAAATADHNNALAAFLEGAGMPNLTLGADPEAALRAAGVLFRAFVAGTREVLMSRTEIKQELRVDRTMLRARDNNALKFSVSTEEALAALLQPGRPGYKAPLAAVQEAFSDVRSHEMAVMAGLQTALIALLKRFDPAALEGRLKTGMLDSILPGARKARFWELFCATYKDIAGEAEDDFHAVFGREFARAYDAQIRKL